MKLAHHAARRANATHCTMGQASRKILCASKAFNDLPEPTAVIQIALKDFKGQVLRQTELRFN